MKLRIVKADEGVTDMSSVNTGFAKASREKCVIPHSRSRQHGKQWMAFTVLLALFFVGLASSALQAAVVETIQSGTSAVAGTTLTVNLAPPVTDDKSILLFTSSSASAAADGPNETHVTGKLICSAGTCSQIQFDRLSTGSAVDTNWNVVEFTDSSDVMVYRGELVHTALIGSFPAVATIALGVDPATSFALITERVGGTVTSNDDFSRAQIDAAGNLVLSVTEMRPDGVIAYQVIDYGDATVQSNGTADDVFFNNNGSGPPQTIDVTVSNVDPEKAWLIYSYRTTGTTTSVPANGAAQNQVSGRIFNSTTLRFEREYASGNGDVYLSYFLVEFADDTRVQHDFATFTSSELQKDVTLPRQVFDVCAVPTAGYHERGGHTTFDTNDSVSTAWFQIQLINNGTAIRLIRGDVGASNDTAGVGWFVLEFPCYDFGDLPDTTAGTAAGDYQTSAANGGAHNAIDPRLTIGSAIDFESDGQPDATATGDDNAGDTPDDENGVTIPADIFTGSSATFPVVVTNNTGSAATLYGFIDWNNDGDFLDADEAVTTPVADGTTAGTVNLVFDVPGDAVTGTGLGARVRLSTDGSLTANGAAADGETEDHYLAVDELVADVAVTKTLTTPGPYVVGKVVSYDIVVVNNGPNTAINIAVKDMSKGLDGVSITAVNNPDPDVGDCTVGSGFPCNIADMANGETVTLTVTGTVQ